MDSSTRSTEQLEQIAHRNKKELKRAKEASTIGGFSENKMTATARTVVPFHRPAAAAAADAYAYGRRAWAAVVGKESRPDCAELAREAFALSLTAGRPLA